MPAWLSIAGKVTEVLKLKVELNHPSLNKAMLAPVERSIIQINIPLRRKHDIVDYCESEFLSLVDFIQKDKEVENKPIKVSGWD